MGRKNIAEKRFEREQEFESQFFSCEKDTKTIVEKLFINTQPYSDYLKRLLLINTKDCLDNKINPDYVKKIQNTQVKDLNYIAELYGRKSYIDIDVQGALLGKAKKSFKLLDTK